MLGSRKSKNTSRDFKGPVVVIVGPTASGKTGAAISLAKKIGGEVISADSRAIYKHMDVGTAKPTKWDMMGVPHFGIDLVKPNKRFTVADFKKYAEQKIYEIEKRGHIPIVAGGTGLYIDALIFNYQFDGESKDSKHGTAEGRKSAGKCKDRAQMDKRFLVYGISWSMDELGERIEERMNDMYDDPELYRETAFLVKKYGWNNQAMTSNVYQYVWGLMIDKLSFADAMGGSVMSDYCLAKKQMTWFKRNKNIKWCKLDKLEEKILKDLEQNT